MTRAKFKCITVKDSPEYEQKLISLSPVIDGGEENKSFAKYTPAGNISLNISYDTQASNFFEEDEEYYVDFTKA